MWNGFPLSSITVVPDTLPSVQRSSTFHAQWHLPGFTSMSSVAGSDAVAV